MAEPAKTQDADVLDAEVRATGDDASGEYLCPACGYGIALYTELPLCPMCGGEVWEESGGTPGPEGAE